MKSRSIKKQAQLVDEIMAEFRQTGSQDESALENRITELVRNFNIESHSPPSLSREVTILFSDIRGFTAMSERYEAIQIVTMLNRYFSKMNEIILKYDGLIDKYMGDAIMVLFGAPEQDINDAHRAINCAVEMQNAMSEVNNENMAQGLPELYMGIGINTGTVLAGQVGSHLHNEYTVIGDGVNLASRVESHSLRGQILISDYTYQQVKDNVLIGNINEVYVKGKSEMIKLYEIIATYWQNEMTVPHREIRTSMRVEIDTPFAFQVIENNEVMPGIYHGQAKDISYNGIFAIIQQPLEVLTNIKLSLSLSLLGGDTRDIYGKIMSLREMSNGYGCGIEFTSLDEDSQQAIKNFIDRVIGGS
jgi:adenylate cyclase